MIDILKDAVKAGAYVWHERRFVFMFGYGGAENALNVVRLGGHREENETPLECALREVREESRLAAEPYDAPVTYFSEDEKYTVFRGLLDAPRPIFIRQQAEAQPGRWMVMYLTRARGELKPCMETQGLLCVSREELDVLCAGGATIRALREIGAEIYLAAPLPEEEPLVATAYVLMLNELVRSEPEWLMEYLER